MAGVAVTNWGGDLVSWPQEVVRPKTVDDIVAVMKDPKRYPGPIRAVGSNHSTTRCGIADNGTLLAMRDMDRIIDIDEQKMTVTAEAGALYIDVAKELEQRGLQFYVNVELGNLTVGSGATGGTKDASMPGEYGQVCSYATRIRMVTPAGEKVEFNEDDPELLRMARSSYGLFGVVYEVTFRVRPLRAMRVYHETFSLDEFARDLPSLRERNQSMMMYIDPFLDRITVEFREYREEAPGPGTEHRRWRLRNFVWKGVAPGYSHYVSKLVPGSGVRSFLVDSFNRVNHLLLRRVVRQDGSVPTDQMIRYPEKGGRSKYTFSIWAFPEEDYIRVLRDYFSFVKDYYRATGYRCDLMNVGYRIAADDSSVFSYSQGGTVMTVDPVSTGNPGWEAFLVAYNEFCSQHDGVPLFNQSKALARHQVKKAFGERIDRFNEVRRKYDPDDQMLNAYFRELLA